MSKRRWLLFGTAIAAVLVIAVAVEHRPLMYWWLHVRPFSASDFDAKAWHAGLPASSNGECVRGRMANDIIATVAKSGQPKKAVEQALGIPQAFDGEAASYELGMCSGFRMDYDFLYIEYANGKVVRAYIVQQ